VVVGQRLDSHACADYGDDEQAESHIFFSFDLGNDIDTKQGSKYLNKADKNLVKINVKAEFIQTEQGAIIDEFY